MQENSNEKTSINKLNAPFTLSKSIAYIYSAEQLHI